MLAHDAGDLIAAGLAAPPAQLLPGLAGAVRAPLDPGSLDLAQQLTVSQLATGRHPRPTRVVLATGTPSTRMR